MRERHRHARGGGAIIIPNRAFREAALAKSKRNVTDFGNVPPGRRDAAAVIFARLPRGIRTVPAALSPLFPDSSPDSESDENPCHVSGAGAGAGAGAGDGA